MTTRMPITDRSQKSCKYPGDEGGTTKFLEASPKSTKIKAFVLYLTCFNFTTLFKCGCFISLLFFLHFILVSWGGVRLNPLGTSATIWPTVPAPDDR
jgi:hypothetical protein